MSELANVPLIDRQHYRLEPYIYDQSMRSLNLNRKKITRAAITWWVLRVMYLLIFYSLFSSLGRK